MQGTPNVAVYVLDPPGAYFRQSFYALDVGANTFGPVIYCGPGFCQRS